MNTVDAEGNFTQKVKFLVKNKYVGRTFIAPGQDRRLDQVKIKLNAIRGSVVGKWIHR